MNGVINDEFGPFTVRTRHYEGIRTEYGVEDFHHRIAVVTVHHGSHETFDQGDGESGPLAPPEGFTGRYIPVEEGGEPTMQFSGSVFSSSRVSGVEPGTSEQFALALSHALNLASAELRVLEDRAAEVVGSAAKSVTF